MTFQFKSKPIKPNKDNITVKPEFSNNLNDADNLISSDAEKFENLVSFCFFFVK